EPTLGVVLVFEKAYDREKLKAGLKNSIPGDVKKAVVSPSETVAVMLVNLDEQTYGRPQTDKTGPLTQTIREAATGKHLIAAGSTIANLPEAIRNEMIP